MSWQNVQSLRKAGNLQEAYDTGLSILAEDPQDFRTRGQLEWVVFDQIKRSVAGIKESLDNSKPLNVCHLNEIMKWMRVYYRLRPRIPELACSSILGQLAKVGAHLPKFPEIIRWVGIDGLRNEDWEPNQYQGKAYPSLAMNIARNLCKWAKTHPEASEEHIHVALEWADRIRNKKRHEDALWLSWDMVALLRQMHDFQRAAEVLAEVVKAKRNEFWVWAEAGRLYRSEQPELALACFCRALECPTEQKFLVKAHGELAELLAELGEHAQASKEVSLAIDLRVQNRWELGRELQSLSDSAWYDPSATGAEDPRHFYARFSKEALVLCFDRVETQSATYLGNFTLPAPKEPRPGWKQKTLSRFAIKDGKGRAWTYVGQKLKGIKADVGAPMRVVIGRQDNGNRTEIMHVSPRPEGHNWDCLEQGKGVVTREEPTHKSMRLMLADTGDEVKVEDTADSSLRVGDSVRFYRAANPKNNRVDVFNVEQEGSPDSAICKHIQGVLRRNSKGFAFVEDVFVEPFLLASVGSTIEQVAVTAVYTKHPKENKRSWRAISLTAC